MERKLFTALQGDNAQKLNDSLSRQGFRRSQNVLYRPSCTECSACLSARIDVARFTPTRSQKRVQRRNQHLSRGSSSPWASDDQYALFREYLDARHADGGMADMDVFEFASMIEETPVRSRIIEYTDDFDGTLSAVSLTDVIEDGVSMVYSFFNPDLEKDSPGTFMILDHIAIARELGLPYVYLGYWVPGSQKMGYKARFSGLEVYYDGKWKPVADPKSFSNDLHPLSNDPIAEQVANIHLPDRRPTKR